MDSNLASALSQAQAEFPPIPKSKEVTVKSDKGSYKFRYAPLEAIIGAVRPALAKHGLAVNHTMRASERGMEIVAVLRHKSGEFDECAMPIALAGRIQEQGSEISYKRRYTLQCVLGVAADDDDDANAADGNNIEQQTERAFKKPAIPPSPAENKAQEIQQRLRAAKDEATLDKIVADNKGHIDAFSDELRNQTRGVYQGCRDALRQRKAA